MDKAEALFVYETAGRLLAADLNAYSNVNGKSVPAEMRNAMVVMATDTALVLWQDVLNRVVAAKVPPPPPDPQPMVRS